MTIPRTTDIGHEYTEFDGMPLEWWAAYGKKKGAIERDIKPKAQAVLDILLPDQAMQAHVARVGQSEQGSTTLLTTSGQAIQIQQERKLIVVPKDIDHKGVAVLMSYYERYGQKVGIDQIPFRNTASPEFRQHVTKLWAEVKAQQEPASARPSAAPKVQTPRAQPAFA